VRRHWLDEATLTDLVALCQFLLGPASSQLGFSIGLIRAGFLGGFAAWAGFTLPSAIALVFFAYAAEALNGRIGMGLRYGLSNPLQPCYFFARAFLTYPTSIMIAMPPTPDPATLPPLPLAASEPRTAVSS
jgi:Chromate transporter